LYGARYQKGKSSEVEGDDVVVVVIVVVVGVVGVVVAAAAAAAAAVVVVVKERKSCKRSTETESKSILISFCSCLLFFI
jgi:hypothetical protein